MIDRCDSDESMDTVELMSSSRHAVISGNAAGATAADTASTSSCPALSNESQDVQQFLTSHTVNGGVVDLLIAYLTELSQRWHLTW